MCGFWLPKSDMTRRGALWEGQTKNAVIQQRQRQQQPAGAARSSPPSAPPTAPLRPTPLSKCARLLLETSGKVPSLTHRFLQESSLIRPASRQGPALSPCASGSPPPWSGRATCTDSDSIAHRFPEMAPSRYSCQPLHSRSIHRLRLRLDLVSD
jgi:hypothetical protein